MAAFTGRSIVNLPEQVAELSTADQMSFDNLFRVTRARGSLDPPPEMHTWIEQSFGSVGAVQNQSVVKVLNRWTLEGALFNDLRARRPVERKAGWEIPPEVATDPFRHPLTGTPADLFGRIRGGHSISASNVAKYDGLHAVIISETYNPLMLTEDQVVDAFATAWQWIEHAHTATPRAAYPFLMWNCLPRSGASRVHAHLQATLGEGGAYAHIEMWRRAMEAYTSRHRSSYIDELYRVHDLLNLAGHDGDVRWFSHLTPVKEKEIILIHSTMDEVLYRTVFRVLRLYIDVLGVRAFNLGLYHPPLLPTDEPWTGFPVVVRIVDRGDPASATNDVASMELFAQPVVAFDPFTLADYVRQYLE